MPRDIGYERDRADVYSPQMEVPASFDAAQDAVAMDQMAVNAIIAHVKNGGQPALTPEIEQRARERNLMGVVYEKVGIGGPELPLLTQVTRRIIDPEGKWAGTQVSTSDQAPASQPKRYYRA